MDSRIFDSSGASHVSSHAFSDSIMTPFHAFMKGKAIQIEAPSPGGVIEDVKVDMEFIEDFDALDDEVDVRFGMKEQQKQQLLLFHPPREKSYLGLLSKEVVCWSGIKYVVHKNCKKRLKL